MSLWTREYGTGVAICAVCGLEKGTRKSCCRVAPYVTLEAFAGRVSPGEVIDGVIRDFYDDYRHSDSRSLAAYIRSIRGE